MRKLSNNFFLERYGLQVRLVTENDAQFIVDLRTDSRLSKHISITSSDIGKQQQWIQNYKQREEEGEEYYFIIQLDGVPIGTYRLYNIEGDRFTSGSWLFSSESPTGASILGALLCKEIAYNELGLKRDFGDTRKDNKRVLRHNMTFEPVIVGEDELNLYFETPKENFERIKVKYIEQCTKVMRQALHEKQLNPDTKR
jgi:hypothetical protein